MLVQGVNRFFPSSMNFFKLKIKYTASNRLLNYFPHRLSDHPDVTTSMADIWPLSLNGFTLDISHLVYHLVAMKVFQGCAHLSLEILCKNLLMQLCKSVRSLISWPLQQYLPLQDVIWWFCWHWSQYYSGNLFHLCCSSLLWYNGWGRPQGYVILWLARILSCCCIFVQLLLFCCFVAPCKTLMSK